MRGFVHLYCGDGKGKTTAAVGLSVRASGAGKSVLFTQFLKDGSSSELNVLRALPNVKVLCCARNFGFFRSMDKEARAAARRAYTALLEETLQKVRTALRCSCLTKRSPPATMASLKRRGCLIFCTINRKILRSC